MLKSDKWIKEQAAKGMITPFEPSLIRQVDDLKVLSYGCSSYGYDITLSPKEFKIFKHVPGVVCNPKAFNPANLESVELHCDEYGKYFILPGNSYGLGVTANFIDVPVNVTCLILGKSSYARLGIICNATPAESGWRGHLTLEFSNSSCADCRIYADEGIAQVLFFEGDPCEVTYSDRSGKYQDQPHAIVTARV